MHLIGPVLLFLTVGGFAKPFLEIDDRFAPRSRNAFAKEQAALENTKTVLESFSTYLEKLGRFQPVDQRFETKNLYDQMKIQATRIVTEIESMTVGLLKNFVGGVNENKPLIPSVSPKADCAAPEEEKSSAPEDVAYIYMNKISGAVDVPQVIMTQMTEENEGTQPETIAPEEASYLENVSEAHNIPEAIMMQTLGEQIDDRRLKHKQTSNFQESAASSTVENAFSTIEDEVHFMRAHTTTEESEETTTQTGIFRNSAGLMQDLNDPYGKSKTVDILPRKRRQVQPETNEIDPGVVTKQAVDGKSGCAPDENRHIIDLKSELNKLRELVKILREQQEVLNALNEVDLRYCREEMDKGHSCKGVAEERKLMKLLESLNQKLENSKDFKSDSSIEETTTAISDMNSEGDKQITDLQNEVSRLKLLVDKALLMGKPLNAEDDIGTELKHQNDEIHHIKNLLTTLIESKTSAKNSSRKPDPRNSERADFSNVAFIQEQINDIQQKIRSLMSNQKNPDLVMLTPNKDPETEEELQKLNHNIEDLKELVGKAFDVQDNGDVLLGTTMERISRPGKVETIAKKAPLHIELHPHAERKSDRDDLRELLNQISRELADDESSEIRDKISELEKQLKKKKPQKLDFESQLSELEKQIRELKKDSVSGRDLDADDDQMVTTMRKLKRMLIKLEKKNRGFEDEDLEDELKGLQEAINRLQPKDEQFESKQDASFQFQTMLQKLISQSQQPAPPKASQQFQMSPQEVAFLQKKLFALQNTARPEGPYFFNDGDFQAPSKFYVPPVPNPEFDYGADGFPYSQPPTAAYKKQQFFPGYEKVTPGNRGPGGSGDGFNPQQPYAVAPPTENGPVYPVQQVGDLKAQIYNLQNAVAALNKPEYTKTPEDQSTVYKLNQEIADLKNIVNGVGPNVDGSYPDASGYGVSVNKGNYPSSDNAVVSNKGRHVRSAETDELSNALEKMAGYLKEAFKQEEKGAQKENMPESMFERRSDGEMLQQKIEDLKKQLGQKFSGATQRKASYPVQSYTYGSSQSTGNPFQLTPLENKIKEKKLDVFEKVITKIIDIVVDKIVITIPILIKKLFGIGVGNSGYYTEGYNSYELKSLAGLGIFGYFPLVILKLVNGFSYFINLLKKNKFLRNVLMPVLVLVGVSGLILFLIWWMQPDDYYGSKGETSTYGKNYDYSENYANGYRNSLERPRTDLNVMPNNIIGTW